VSPSASVLVNNFTLTTAYTNIIFTDFKHLIRPTACDLINLTSFTGSRLFMWKVSESVQSDDNNDC